MGRGFRGLPTDWEKGHPSAFRGLPEAPRVLAGSSLCPSLCPLPCHPTTCSAAATLAFGPSQNAIHSFPPGGLPPASHASSHISTGLSSNVTQERPSWPHVTLLYCLHSSHLPTPLMCSCPPPHSLQVLRPIGSRLDPQRLHRLPPSRCSMHMCQITQRSSKCLRILYACVECRYRPRCVISPG